MGVVNPWAVIFAGLGSVGTAVAAAVVQNKTVPQKLSFSYASAHQQAQDRINWMLGGGFNASYVTDGSFGGASNKAFLSTEGDQDTNKLVFMKQLCSSGYSNAVCSFVNRDDIIGTVNRWLSQGNLRSQGGWKYTPWMHYSSPDDAMKNLYLIATSGNDFKPALSTGDTYKAYSYPSPEIVAQYGNNLSYFIRCAPDNLGCQLIGKNISLSSVLAIIGSSVGAFITGGAGIPLLVAAVSSFASQLSNAPANPDGASALKTGTDLLNIYNGANIDVKNGSVDQVRAIAQQFVNGNPNLFGSA